MSELEWPSHEAVNSHDDPLLFELIEYLCGVRTIEPDVTEAIKAAIPEGAAPHGLQFRVKHWDSLRRKVLNVVGMDPYAFDGLESTAEIAKLALRRIDDVLRYSVRSEAHKDLPMHASLFLRKAGLGRMSVVSVLNTYHPESRYKGLHAILSLQERFSFDMGCEVQFHSPESIDAYEATHLLYEQLRIDEDLANRQQLHDEIATHYERVENIAIGNNAFPVPITDRVYRRPTK